MGTKVLQAGVLLFTLLTGPRLAAQPTKTVTFNVNKVTAFPSTGSGNVDIRDAKATFSGPSIIATLTDTYPNNPAFNSKAVVTFSAPAGSLSGSEFTAYLSGGPAIVFDNPVTFQATSTFTNSDDVVVFQASGYAKNASQQQCFLQLTPKKPTGTCTFQTFPIIPTDDKNPTGGRSIQLSYRVDYGVSGGSGPDTSGIINYDYDTGCGASASHQTGGRSVCGNTLGFGPVFPAAGTPIFIPASGQSTKDSITRSPDFVAPVNFQLQTKDKGEIGLELRTQDTSDGKPGKLIAISSGTIKVNKGSGQAGYTAPFLIIAPFAFSSVSFGSSTLDDSNTTELVLRAVMTDPTANGAILATSEAVRYPAVAAKVTLELDSLEAGPQYKPIDPATVTLGGGLPLYQTSQGKFLIAGIGYKLPTDAQAKLSFRLTETNFDGAVGARSSPITALVSGTGALPAVFPSESLYRDTASVEVRIAMTLLGTGQTVLSAPLTLLANAVNVREPTPPTAQQLLAAGIPASIKIPVTVVVRDPGLRLYRDVTYDSSPTVTTLLTGDLALGPQTFNDSFSIDLPSSTKYVDIIYSLRPKQPDSGELLARSDETLYGNFKTVAQLAADKTIDAVVFVNGQFVNVKSKVNKAIDITGTVLTLLFDDRALKLACFAASGASLIGKVSQNLLPYLKYLCPPGTFVAAEHASAPYDVRSASATPDMMTIYSWLFDPLIAADGTFSGDVVFNYSAALLPDDPNFDESKLQILAFDNKTGAVTPIPAALDKVRKTASAHLNELAPVYALGAVGPFTNSSLTFPDTTASATLSLVNFGSAAAAVTLRGFSNTGQAIGTAPPNVAVPPGQQYVKVSRDQFPNSPADPASPSLTWVRADGGNAQLLGAQTITDGAGFDVLPNAPRATTGPWVVTAVEQSEATSTRLLLTNPGTQTAAYTVSLFDADGKDKGTFSTSLAPKQQSASSFSAMFPTLAASFQGYAVVWSSQPITVAEELIGGSTIAALHAQIPSAGQASILYAPRLGGSSGATTLTLVNLGTAKANITVRGFNPSGGAVGTPASFPLNPGQQYRNSLAAALGIDETQTGTLVIASDQSGLVGALDLSDPISKAFRATLPLDSAPSKSAAIAYVAQGSSVGTSLAISNTSTGIANVSIRVINSSGALAGSKDVSLAAKALAFNTLANLVPGAGALTTGFVTITSDQPVTAAALLSSRSELGFLPAQPVNLAPAGGGGPTPQISGGGVVNAASFTTKLVRGGLASIFGSNFVSGNTTFSAPSIPWGTLLGGVSVFVNNIPAPLYFVSATQINFQVPFEIPAGSTATVFVVANGVASPAVNVGLADYGIGVFTYARTAGAVDPIIVHATDNTLVTPTSQAQPNEFLVAYATGIGKLKNAPVSGAGAPGSALAQSVDLPVVTLAGTPVKVLFAGLTPGFVGLVQLNLQLGPNLPTGTLPLVITTPGDVSPAVNLAVKGNLAAAPIIGVTPNSLSFGSVTVGQTSDLPLTVTNNGSATLNVTSIGLTGAAFRVVSSAPPFGLAPGGSQTVTVRFSPTASGTQNGTLTIASNDTTQPSLAVSLSGTGAAAAAPAISLAPSSLDFGSVTVNQTKDLTLSVNNTGNAPLNVSSITSSNARFTITSATNFSVAGGGSQSVNVRFSPNSAGAQSGTLTIASNDPSRGSVGVSLTGTGTAAAAPAISVSPAALDFGSVSVNQTKDVTLTISNTGTGNLTVTSIVSSSARFTIVGGTAAGLSPGATFPITVRFAPIATGAHSGTLTIASNDPARPSLAVNLSGTGTGSAVQSVTLAVDDGSYEEDIGFGGGGVTAWFVNRLTPPSYPATLRGVQIFFTSDELPAGTSIKVVVATGTGAANINNVPFQQVSAQITSLDRFTQYSVPAITISSGDFIVGFNVVNPTSYFPMTADSSSPSRQRSYLSSDGFTFSLVDSTPAGAANFAIRAVVDVGGSTAQHGATTDAIPPEPVTVGPPRRRISVNPLP